MEQHSTAPELSSVGDGQTLPRSLVCLDRGTISVALRVLRRLREKHARALSMSHGAPTW